MTTAETHAHQLLLTSREAAQRLAIGERTLWELTRRGEVLCVRIGRAVRYAPADLQSYVDRRKGGQQ
jgi:excisionase family DNA binding protein